MGRDRKETSWSQYTPRLIAKAHALGDNAVKNYWNTTMQRKYRRSLSAGSNLPHPAPRRSSISPYENWQRITPQGNSSPTPARYHPYSHHPRTPPATPDRAKVHVSPQSLPPLLIPRYTAPSSRSPYSAEVSPGYGAAKQLPDIHTVFASPSPSPSNIQLPPLQQTWQRSLSEPGYFFAPVSAPSSPTPTITHDSNEQVKDRMRLDSLLS